ncbi:hypothetical protein F5883DRAFT_656770 [Diaporthe sp. PMI_573]|nr:hypothetical protein F5883DRAFT_656770 [Diaporthaceae sp. PMI_573]
MNTPTHFIFQPFKPEELVESLGIVAKDLEEATPELESPNDRIEQSYKWICEDQHRHFKQYEVDRLRLGITSTQYWQYEAQHLFRTLWRQLLAEHGLTDMSTASCWLKLAQALEHILQNHGLSSENIRELSVLYRKPELLAA